MHRNGGGNTANIYLLDVVLRGDMIKTGDIMVCTGNDPISWIIRGITFHSTWSHAQIVVGWPWVCSADFPKVRVRKVHDSELKKYRILRLWNPYAKQFDPLTDDELKKILDFCHTIDGTDYDLLGLVMFGVKENPGAWYCSEVPHYAYSKVAGRPFLVRTGWVYPSMIDCSPLLEVVESVGI
jgi:hypothetical protein